jgi:hypothetical protein
MGWCGRSGLEWGPVEGCCEHGNEPLCSTKCCKILEYCILPHPHSLSLSLKHTHRHTRFYRNSLYNIISHYLWSVGTNVAKGEALCDQKPYAISKVTLSNRPN